MAAHSWDASGWTAAKRGYRQEPGFPCNSAACLAGTAIHVLQHSPLTCTCANTCVRKNTHTKNTHTRDMHTHTHMQTHMHIHTHAHSTNTHTRMLTCPLAFLEDNLAPVLMSARMSP